MTRATVTFVVLAFAATLCATAARAEPAGVGNERRLNEIQIIGSHNSFKQLIEPPLYQLMLKAYPDSRELDYGHLPLADQLTLGLRNLELDLYNDPEGGLYATPLGLKLVAWTGGQSQPFDSAGVLAEPGFKVMHVADFDFRSTNLTLQGCLAELRGWSEAHPDHLPVFVTINLKERKVDFPGTVAPIPFDADAFDRLDVAIVAGLGRDRVLTPDDVRADAATLEEAVTTRGWPVLGSCRGRFLFLLDTGEERRRSYAQGRPSLRGRSMFVTSEPGTPEAAAFIVNDPLSDGDRIRDLVRRGYVVRTRADADMVEARAGSFARFGAAKSSGAQIITTDYYRADPRINADYQIRFEDGGFARLNPVTARTTAPLARRSP